MTPDFENNHVHFPNLSLQLKPHHGKFECGAFELKAFQKVLVGPFQQVMVRTIAATEIKTSFGITEATLEFLLSPKNLTSLLPQQGTSSKMEEQPSKSWTRIATHSPSAMEQLLLISILLTPREASHVPPRSLKILTLVFSHPEEASSVINLFF